MLSSFTRLETAFLLAGAMCLSVPIVERAQAQVDEPPSSDTSAAGNTATNTGDAAATPSDDDFDFWGWLKNDPQPSAGPTLQERNLERIRNRDNGHGGRGGGGGGGGGGGSH